jgi:hypothetical protein
MLVAGCTVSGVVVDIYEKSTELTKMKLSPGGNFLVFDGNGVRTVALAEIEKMVIFPHETRSHDGKLFYLTAITFTENGRTIGSSREYGPEDQVFVSVDAEIGGKSAGGSYTIDLDRVSEIIIDK